MSLFDTYRRSVHFLLATAAARTDSAIDASRSTTSGDSTARAFACIQQNAIEFINHMSYQLVDSAICQPERHARRPAERETKL
jgi:tRNA U38,U39,U40 pseudouridine synthase TruA